MNPIVPIIVGGLLLSSLPFIGLETTKSQPDKNTEVPQQEKDITENLIHEGDTFADILASSGVPYDQALAVIDASKEVFDFSKIQAGKTLKLVLVNSALASVEYPLNSDTRVVVDKDVDGFSARKESIQYQVTETVASGIISDSLFAAAGKVGIEDKVTLGLADIFAGDIDFATDIRSGDSFAVVYERRSLDGKDVGAGSVLAARFTNDGTTYTAYRFKNGFYNEEGEAFSRQFLKSPLSYALISSGFSYKRTNPVTKQVTAHRAIDYAADSGTPVIATADGKVITAGSKGGLGITVELKHGGYMTQYAHLSKIAKGVKTGVMVTQGDVIGYVGSTGISTGPHLQYAMFNEGNPINPLTVVFPRGESVPQSDMSEFETVKRKYVNKLK
jgi:murein DD-endopeptidase MepM/ murein hydrolase activator NlpD